MKQFAIAFAALLSLSAISAASGQNCEAETDEFKGTESISCTYHEMDVEEQPAERLLTARAMIASTGGMHVLALYTRSDSWNFLDSEKAYGRIDGERHEWELAKVERDVDSGTVTEIYGAVLSEEDLRRIAGAESVRIKVGSAVYNLSGSAIPADAQEVLEML